MMYSPVHFIQMVSSKEETLDFRMTCFERTKKNKIKMSTKSMLLWLIIRKAV